ncbi:MAG: NTP transferase domain-containing protein [Flavobacteriales bacterium]|nr:NTP transferase domain-containing protein [Flavobacteriales bacterium]
MSGAWGIVVQARMGSTRLPGKMLREVHAGRTLMELMLERLLTVHPPDRIILATTTNVLDDPLVEIAQGREINVFRGSEHDVLERFLGAARAMQWDSLVRVCADNPFFRPETIAPLAEAGMAANADYAGYFFSDGLPSIRSHCGLFPEWVGLSALKGAAERTLEPLFREHVTNYIYSHPEQFQLVRLPVPDEEQVRKWRLTVDSEADLDLCRQLLADLGGGEVNWSAMVEYLGRSPGLLERMRMNMEQNGK